MYSIRDTVVARYCEICSQTKTGCLETICAFCFFTVKAYLNIVLGRKYSNLSVNSGYPAILLG